MASESGPAAPREEPCSNAVEGGGESALPHEGLKKSERITKQFEYKEVIKEGKLIDRGAYKAFLLVREDLQLKAGFIAGKGVGKAAKRNRARRVLREAYRRLKPNLKSNGFWVVFVAKPQATEAKSTEIGLDMAEMFEKEGLLEGNA